MLITRPQHDLTVNYLYYWSIPLIEKAKKIGKPVFDLAKIRANAKEFSSFVKKFAPLLIVFNGHGNENSVTGHNNNVLVSTKYNLKKLKGSIVYARACRSAKNLGRKSVKNGCRAYLGYDDDFVFITENNKISRPLTDKTAKLFLEPANQIVISLLKGHSVAEANTRSKEKYKQNINRFTASSATEQEKELVPYLFWDYSHQISLGRQDAKF